MTLCHPHRSWLGRPEPALPGEDSCPLVNWTNCYGSGMPEFESAQRAGGDEAARSEVAARSEMPGPTGPAAAAWQLAHAPVRGDPAAPSRRRLSRGQVLALQRAVGNRATTGLVRRVAQRVAITDPAMTETLYNKESAGGQAPPKK